MQRSGERVSQAQSAARPGPLRWEKSQCAGSSEEASVTGGEAPGDSGGRGGLEVRGSRWVG